MQFNASNAYSDLLERAQSGRLNELDFGVIGFDAEDVVIYYNTSESEDAGIDAAAVIGQDLFVEVAPCFNNFLVAERFEEEDDIDDEIEYVLTLKMRPTKVKLRLLKNADQDARFILVRRI